MRVVGAFSDQQQLRCVADTPIRLLSEGIKWDIIRSYKILLTIYISKAKPTESYHQGLHLSNRFYDRRAVGSTDILGGLKRVLLSIYGLWPVSFYPCEELL